MSLAFDEPDLAGLVREQIDRWRAEGGPDAAAFLDEHPELVRAKSLVLDLILEEYCLRTQAGDSIAKSTFCERFPHYRQSVAKMLAMHELLDQCPQFAIDMERSDWPAPGDRFLGFDVLQPLGRGSLARVYLAREPALGSRTVVIKVARIGGREAETLGKLSHPNIVPVHSVRHEIETGWTVICMPLLGTATAVDLLDAAFGSGRQPEKADIVLRVAREARPMTFVKPPPVTEEALQGRGTYTDAVARIGWQLAHGLDQAHGQGILHRDIKPSNVLLAWSGKPMLLDFNLSLEDGVISERIGGTLAYMAPEIITSLIENRGDSARQFDPRCDVYSLGVVLFELLTGRLPARPESADLLPLDAYQPWLESKRLAADAVSSLGTKVDPRLRSIVAKCLAFEPEARYATARELAEALGAYLGRVATCGRFVKRNRRAVLACAVAALLPIGGISYFVATLPPYHERLLKAGLAEYDRGDYQRAVETFTKCLELKPGWHKARFARGQAYRNSPKPNWHEARADFVALAGVNKAWAFALAGYCNMAGDQALPAHTDYVTAYRAGLRDLGFMLNYAHTSQKLGFDTEAITIYSEVLERDPTNTLAFRNRAQTYMNVGTRLGRLPNERAFHDAREDCRLNPSSFEAHYTAARLFGFAATKDSKYREEGTHFLACALENGMPRNLFTIAESRLRPLVNREIEKLLEAAPAELDGYRYTAFSHQVPLQTANWDEFLKAVTASP
jgi:serine/threonine protein kinase